MKETQWHDEEFEKAIQNYVKTVGSKIQEDTSTHGGQDLKKSL